MPPSYDEATNTIEGVLTTPATPTAPQSEQHHETIAQSDNYTNIQSQTTFLELHDQRSSALITQYNNSNVDYSKATVVPLKNFIPENDVIKLRLDKNKKDELIKVMCHRSRDQRFAIKETFQRLFGVSLTQYFMKKLGFTDFGNLMRGLIIEMHEFMAEAVYKSSSFKWMLNIMFLMTNRDRLMMKNYFITSKQLYNKI